jgi:hypothetical protein
MLQPPLEGNYILRNVMAKSSKPKPDDPKQSKLFIEKAREIEADEKRSAADKLLGRLAQKKPEPHKAKPK